MLYLNFKEPITPGVVKAVLQYENAQGKEPTTKAHNCTEDDKCKVINCPNRYKKYYSYLILINIIVCNILIWVFVFVWVFIFIFGGGGVIKLTGCVRAV